MRRQPNVRAALTRGYSGADLEALCREAALDDFRNAMKRIGPSVRR